MKANKYYVIPIILFIISGFLVSSCSLTTGSITQERYALLIGISEYQNTDMNLTYPAIDATELQEKLENHGWQHTRLVTNNQATKNGIKTAIEEFFANIPADASALIYYSGHGTLSNLGYSGDTWLVPYDFDNIQNWAGGISADELYTWIDAYIDTKNIIVTADSCYSGGLIASSDSYDTIAQEYAADSSNSSYVSAITALSNFGELLAKNANEDGSLSPIFISAAGSEEYSYEDYPITSPYYEGYGNGIFTYFLLKSATEGDANGDGYVTCTEAYTYSARALESEWNTYKRTSAYYPHISGGLRDLVLFTSKN